ncbi:hypothetical protein GVN18_38045 [Pseudomonas sp. ODNR1LW]|nr:hypothetical protein [Pseudomonas sp. ODNR1LW]
MKPSFASSYPVRACANEAGIDYGLALAWVEATERETIRATRRALLSAHGLPALDLFERLIQRVHAAGRVRVRRWSASGDGWAIRAGAAA